MEMYGTHQVTGSGLTIVPPNFFPGVPSFQFRQSISAWQRQDGTVGGRVVSQVEGLTPKAVTMVAEVTCLLVEGNTAYIGSVVLESNSDDPLFAVGGAGIGWIVDMGSAEPDIAYAGPAVFWAPNGETCHDKPFLPPLPIATGNFIVR